MVTRRVRVRLLGLAAVALLSTAACGSGSATASSGSGSGPVEVVASTNVWGQVATAIGGTDVHVTSIISDPSADPHSYEANARTRLAVSRAGVVIKTGGGYDDFMNTLLSATHTKAPVIDAVDVSGAADAAKSAGTKLNEHVWYDFAATSKVASRIASTLASVDPGHGATFKANEATFEGELQKLIAQENTDRATTQGKPVAITEPVPGYLLAALGAVDKTPPAFADAVQNGTDVPATVLQETEALFSSGQVKALVYNSQTTDTQTEQLKRAAQANSVVVVPVTETLPAGKTYIQWMTDNLTAISKALTS